MYRAGLIGAICICGLLALPAKESKGAQTAETAPIAASQPELSVLSYDGLMQFIHANARRVVLVNFWASWCAPCLKEMPDLIALRAAYPEDKLTIIGVSLDYDPAALQAYLQRNRLNFPNYHAEPELMDLMQIHSIPKILIYDVEGHEVVNQAGHIPVQNLKTTLETLIPNP